MSNRDYDFIRDEDEIDRLMGKNCCDECGSTGRCHENCSFRREQDRSED